MRPREEFRVGAPSSTSRIANIMGERNIDSHGRMKNLLRWGGWAKGRTSARPVARSASSSSAAVKGEAGGGVSSGAGGGGAAGGGGGVAPPLRRSDSEPIPRVGERLLTWAAAPSRERMMKDKIESWSRNVVGTTFVAHPDR